MKVINIYNQTFLGNTSGNSWEFSISPTIKKTKQDTKWKVTVCSLGMMFQSGTPLALIIQSSNFGCSTATYQLDDAIYTPSTTLTLGIINATNNQQTITYSPTQFFMDELSFNPFTVYFKALQDVAAVPANGQVVLSLRFEEVYL